MFKACGLEEKRFVVFTIGIGSVQGSSFDKLAGPLTGSS